MGSLMRTGVRSRLLQVPSRPDPVDLRTVTFQKHCLRHHCCLHLHLPEEAPVQSCWFPPVRAMVLWYIFSLPGGFASAVFCVDAASVSSVAAGAAGLEYMASISCLGRDVPADAGIVGSSAGAAGVAGGGFHSLAELAGGTRDASAGAVPALLATPTGKVVERMPWKALETRQLHCM